MSLTLGFKFFGVLILVATAVMTDGSEAQRQKKILVLGGNGFMGSEAVLRFAAEGFQIITCNRGNWYWDSPVRVKPKVFLQFPCDRDDGLLKCWDFRDYVKDNVDFFDVVVDFTGYSAESMNDATTALKSKIGLYIYISSDSVYMVSRRNLQGTEFDDNQQQSSPTESNPPWKEEHAVRPTSASVRERLREEDPYGDDKLTCEETLVSGHKKHNFPYVILRLPDVIGQRDTTNRWWPYQIWMQFYDKINIPITFTDKAANLRTSFVYVHDVIEALATIVKLNSSDIWNRAYNLAFDDPLSVAELLEATKEVMDLEQVEIRRLSPKIDVEDLKDLDIAGTQHYFPSVTFGHVDTSLAKKLLGWKPTPLVSALKEITDFYKKAFVLQPLQRKRALSTITYMQPEERQVQFRALMEEEIRKLELQEGGGLQKEEPKEEL